MYEELIINLRNCAELNSLSYYKRGLMKQAADAIEELSRENESLGKSLCESVELVRKLSKPKWIPVTERLPESKRQNYLCLIDNGYCCEVRWTDDVFGIGGGNSWNKWGWKLVDVPQYGKVTHWMPLPEPPEEETDGA